MSAIVKPTVGAIDLITRTSQGARNSAATDTIQHSRTRPPRYFASDKVLLPYDVTKSHWQNNVLYWLEQGKHRNEHYVTHFEVGNKILLISTYFVFCLSLKSSSGPQVKWKIAIRDISYIDEKDGWMIFHLQSRSHSLPINNVQEYKVHFAAAEQKQMIYESIKETVNHEQQKPLYCSSHKTS